MKQRIQFIATFTLAAFALTGCGHKPERAAAGSLPAAAVSVQTVERKSRVATEDVVGTVQARLRAIIEAKVSGKIDQMLVVPGQKVKRGELFDKVLSDLKKKYGAHIEDDARGYLETAPKGKEASTK